MTYIKSRLLLSTLIPLTLCAHNAQAAGFYIQESSISAMGSAFAGSVTNIDDASTVFFNPAGMTDLKGAQLNTGAHVIIPNADLTNTGSTVPTGGLDSSDNPYSATPVPNFFAAMPISGDKVWLGVGTSAPFGLASEYDEDWFGRYDSTKTKLKTINVSTVLAYKINDKISIGGGLDMQYADANLQAVAFAGTEGESRLAGDDLSFGYNIGLTAKPLEGTEIGLHYRYAVDHELAGTISAEGTGGADFSAPATVNLKLPDITTLGVSQSVNDKLKLMGQVTWFGWENFKEIRAVSGAGTTLSNTPQNYENAIAIAVGAEYDYSEKLRLRVGYQFDETPTVDEFRTSRTPDGDRNWFTLGGTYNLNEKMSVDFSGAYIDIGEETINVSRNGGLSTVQAKTEGEIGILSFGLNYKF
jgi:long-chain fatty acid transport protein